MEIGSKMNQTLHAISIVYKLIRGKLGTATDKKFSPWTENVFNLLIAYGT